MTLASTAVPAKPIAFASGTSVMAEYGAGTMAEAQAFYAPSHRYSLGGGYLRLDSDVDGATYNIAYVRANWLAHRWNLEAAQANLFLWGGGGSARSNTFRSYEATGNVGAQADYETRRVYLSAKTDVFDASSFTDRIDTLQFGFAPYAHEYDSLATWIVIQARTYTNDIYPGTEWALLLRLFRRNAWVEAGVTEDGKLQSMLMFNF